MSDGTFDHGYRSYGDDTWDKLMQPVELENGNGITKCDKCQCDIQVNYSVATEHNLVAEFIKLGFDAHMEQTGGMCSACGIDRENGCYLITYDYDGNNKLRYYIGAFNSEGDWEEDFGLEFDKFEDVVEAVKELKDIKKSEVN
jgi:hypothetical protein